MNILHLETIDDDAVLFSQTLRAAGIFCDITRVHTRQQYLEQIQEPGWDLIVAEYGLPGFDGIWALKLALAKNPELPFIFISDIPGEDVAVEALKIGACDYVVKGRLERLAPVLLRALRDAQLRATQKQAAQTLLDDPAAEEGERRFQRMADSIPQLAWMAKPDGSIFWYNRRWYEYTDTSPEQMKGWGWQSVHDPTMLPIVLERWRNSIRNGEPFEMNIPLRGGDGMFRWFLTRVFPFKDSQGEVVQWFGTNTDVTEITRARETSRDREEETRKLNEELELRVQERTAQLSDSEERYRTLLDNIKDCAILMLDAQGYIVSWNSSAERLEQYTAAEIIGKHFSCFYLPEDVAAGLPAELLKTSAREGHSTHEGWRVRKDGTHFWGSVIITVLRDQSGMVRGFTKITSDTSERKRAEDLLQAQTNRLKQQAALLDLAHDAILVRAVGESSKIMFWNSGAVETYGYERDQAIGIHSHDLLRTSFPQPLDLIEAELTRTERWEGELIHTTRSGLVINVASRWALQRDHHGEPESVMEINRNISVQKEVEKELRRANERLKFANGELKIFSRKLEASNLELQDFASVAAHDLQEPLRKVQAFGDRLKLLLVDANLDHRAQDSLNRMLSATNRMQCLIRDLLSFCRVTSQAHVFERVDLTCVAQEVLSDLEVPIAETDALVEVGDLPSVEADRRQMGQLLQNLISNALKFRIPGQAPFVRILGEIDPEDGACRLVITDNGIGFDEKYLDRIFTVFQRLHSRAEYEGTGVGLAICRKIANRHGGDITARSAVNEGATFTVTLPWSMPTLAQQAGVPKTTCETGSPVISGVAAYE